MKWRNHMVMAVSVALMLDLHPAEIAVCAAAVNLPDQMEKIGKVRIIGHRTWTHELLLWLVPLLFFLAFPQIAPNILGYLSISGGPPPQEFFIVRAWVLFLPGLIHLCGDMLTPRGIQAAGRKISLKLFETGHPLEYFVAVLFFFLALIQRMGWNHFIFGA